jgi:dihydroorotate dehydrogenase electron transfer subunit
MKKYCVDLTVKSIERLSDKHVLIKLTDEKPLPDMVPGQFVEIKVDGSSSTFLRRPISINFFSCEQNEMWLLVATVGDGTMALAKLNTGDKLSCLFPLGNGFSMQPKNGGKKVLLVGGGVGVAPLLYMGSELKKQGLQPTFLLGARSKNDLLELDLFKEIGDVCVTTEDGSLGEKGFVTNHSILNNVVFDLISCCGPKPMMMAVARYAKKADIECEVSLENMMACGLGACLCCVEKTVEGNVCVCKEGPVFNINKLTWQI